MACRISIPGPGIEHLPPALQSLHHWTTKEVQTKIFWDWKGILLQIIKRCNRVIEKVSNISETDFSLNDDIKEVVCFNLFQIGELANGLSVEFINEYNKIPWKQIIGMRNRIVHGYDTINLEIVWSTAIESIPELKSYCKEILG